MVFIPVTVYTLDRAYTSSLEEAKYNELKLMNLALISAFEFEDSEPMMPEFLYDEQLNLPGSGYTAMIVIDNHIIWQSASALDVAIDSIYLAPPVGAESFNTNVTSLDPHHTPYFVYAFSAEFESGDTYVPVNFYVFNDEASFSTERKTFLTMVWQYLILLGVGLIFMLMLGMRKVLAPVTLLINEIQATSKGQNAQLSHDYPPEFTPLKHSINQLLKTEAQQRQRYKNSLGDLAHSLKTPLAVALGTPGLPSEAKDSLNQINNLIQRQLKRATAGSSGWDKPVPIAPEVKRLFNALSKVYRDKSLSFQLSGSEGEFYGDKTDLMELLGNILDNACKAATRTIKVLIEQNQHWTNVIIDDDGPGIHARQSEEIISRGTRLDTYSEGQGIGMAVVADLLAIYEGQLAIETNLNKGARIIIRLPRKHQD
jgi:two-component system sensor histidine kinase PhoQ